MLTPLRLIPVLPYHAAVTLILAFHLIYHRLTLKEAALGMVLLTMQQQCQITTIEVSTKHLPRILRARQSL